MSTLKAGDTVHVGSRYMTVLYGPYQSHGLEWYLVRINDDYATEIIANHLEMWAERDNG